MTAALVLGAAVYAQKLTTSEVSDRYQLEALGASHNMRYVTGMNVATFGAFIWDTQTNVISEMSDECAGSDFRCVTDEGRAYGAVSAEDMVTFLAATFDTTGATTLMEQSMSSAYACTPDGSIVVGCMLDEIMWWPTACVWRNGVRTELPVPTKSECGIDHDGASAQYVSADGSVIVGYLQDAMSSRPAILWRRQADGSYVADVISRDVWEPGYGMGKPYLKFEPLGISANGKWLCLAAQKEAGGSMPTPEFMVRMNLETGELFESEAPDIDYFVPEVDNIYPTSIANDGTCVGSTRDEVGFQCGVIWKIGDKKPKTLADEFPEIEELLDYDGFQHHPIAISADGTRIVGFACPVTYDSTGAPDYDYVSYYLDFGKDDAIASLHAAPAAAAPCYNLAGQRVSPQHRGIVLQGGRKVLR